MTVLPTSVLPRIPVWGLNILTGGLAVSALARGFDFIQSPNNSSAALSALAEWASPDTLGFILIILAGLALFGLSVQSAVTQAIANIALCAMFLVMGAVSFGPVVAEIGWGWRAPVSYVLGGAVVHWYIANEWFTKWVEARGRHKMDC